MKVRYLIPRLMSLREPNTQNTSQRLINFNHSETYLLHVRSNLRFVYRNSNLKIERLYLLLSNVAHLLTTINIKHTRKIVSDGLSILSQLCLYKNYKTPFRRSTDGSLHDRGRNKGTNKD